MPFDRVRLIQNMQGASGDLNATNELAFANIALAMRGFLAPTASRIYRGFRVEPTGPISASVNVNPGAAMDPNSKMLVLEALTALVVSANGSANPRIDIVQIGYSEATTQTESRKVWNTGTVSFADQNVDVRTRSTVIVSVKAGVAGASPVAPAPDAGYFAIAQILLPGTWTGGGRTVDATMITNLPAARGGGIISQPWDRSGEPAIHVMATDYVSGTLMSLETPQGMNSFLALGFSWVATNAEQQPLLLYLEDAGSGLIVGAAADTHPLALGERTTYILGTVAGPTTGVRNYRLRCKKYDDGGGGTLVDSISMSNHLGGGGGPFSSRMFAITA